MCAPVAAQNGSASVSLAQKMKTIRAGIVTRVGFQPSYYGGVPDWAGISRKCDAFFAMSNMVLFPNRQLHHHRSRRKFRSIRPNRTNLVLQSRPLIESQWAAVPATILIVRRGRESNPRIAVLQTATLPLGYPAIIRQSEQYRYCGACIKRRASIQRRLAQPLYNDFAFIRFICACDEARSRGR